MRDFKYINRYLDELSQDIYSQLPDNGHEGMIADVFGKWFSLLSKPQSVLDVGCGAEAVAKKYFQELKVPYIGISLGEANQVQMDMSFMQFPDNTFDMIWCRHTLEHSPMPLLTLMEFHRVSRNYLCLIMPNPNHFTFIGRNHYFVSERHQLMWWLRRAGWKPLEIDFTEQEYRFFCVKQPRVSYEGYAEAPISNEIHEFERDIPDTGSMNVEEAMRKEDEVL